MRMMKFLLMTLLVSGCSQITYLTEQGYNQVMLQWRGVPNEELLRDPQLAPDKKHKIMLVEEYKKFFYHYFATKASNIYTKTTMLENEAVTYLVVASPHTKIEAHEFKFPFMGSFPYIGFFNKSSAKAFADNLKKEENLVTWIRPVYAYSTLGYLEDRILSSFFEYDDIELAELVFHELFHTVFFIKNEVDLNENLANLYGRELLKEYFQGRGELASYLEREKKVEKINKRAVELIDLLRQEYNKLGGFLTEEKADLLTQRFVTEVFRPELLALRSSLGLSEADYRLEAKEWNQAAFAAFLTYEEEQDFLEKLKQEKKFNLKEYLTWLKMEYKTFDQQDRVESFTDFLKMKVVPNAPLALD
jgi:predicted aminopeptidase